MFRRSRTAETKTRYFSRDYWSGIRKGIATCRWNDQCQAGDAEQDLTITGQINSSGAVLYRRKATVGKKKIQIFLVDRLVRKTMARDPAGGAKYPAATPHVQRVADNVFHHEIFVINCPHDPRSRVAGHASGCSDGNSRRRSIGDEQTRRTRCVRY